MSREITFAADIVCLKLQVPRSLRGERGHAVPALMPAGSMGAPPKEAKREPEPEAPPPPQPKPPRVEHVPYMGLAAMSPAPEAGRCAFPLNPTENAIVP
ncbi:MAG: hypothetical protein WCI73_03385 [Phycisphaerae bacterium]